MTELSSSVVQQDITKPNTCITGLNTSYRQ